MNTKISIGAMLGIPQKVYSKVNILYVGGSTNPWYREMYRQHPGQLFQDLPTAISAIGTDSTTTNVNQTLIVVGYGHPDISASAGRIVIPKTKAGITIVFLPGAAINVAYDLTSNIAAFEIQASDCTVINPVITTTTAGQTGIAMALGGTATTTGHGDRTIIRNARLGGTTTATDFVTDIVVRGSTNARIEDSTLFGSTATTATISVIAGSDTTNGTGLVLKNVYAQTITGSASTKQLVIAASQNTGIVIGGAYYNDSTGINIDNAGNAWTLRDSVNVGNTAAVGSQHHVKFSGTGIFLFNVFAKDIDDATTAPTIMSQADV